MIIDKRFEKVFTDKDFSGINVKVDKYGRKKNSEKRKSQLEKFYKIDAKAKSRLEYLQKLATGEIEGLESSSSESESDTEADDEANTARNIKNSTNSDSNINNEEIDAEEVEETKRLALTGMDWTKVQAQDVFVLLSSFLCTTGTLKSITIYLSIFGEEKLKVEDRYGPQIIDENVSLEEADDEKNVQASFQDEEEDLDLEKLREYEKSRLKYYFAVCEFDSVATAVHVFSECNSLELEKTGVKIDLSFIPSDMKIDRPVKDSYDNSKIISKDYKPPAFVLEALQQSRVELTWDEDTDDRRRLHLWNSNSDNFFESVTDKELEQFIGGDVSNGEEDEEDIARKRKLLLEPDDEEDEEEALLAAEEEFFGETNQNKKASNISDEQTIDAPKADFNDPFFKNPSKHGEPTRKSKKGRNRAKDKKRDSTKLNREKILDKEFNEASDADENVGVEQDFQVDLSDPRFAQAHSDKNYRVDQTSKDFKAQQKEKKRRKKKRHRKR